MLIFPYLANNNANKGLHWTALSLAEKTPKTKPPMKSTFGYKTQKQDKGKNFNM
jgi:hypothetical protein